MSWEPRYVVSKAPGIDGEPIDPGEPVLVIRAQDVLAPAMIDHYRRLYALQVGRQQEVDSEMWEHWHAIARWQSEHPDRVKVADR